LKRNIESKQSQTKLNHLKIEKRNAKSSQMSEDETLETKNLDQENTEIKADVVEEAVKKEDEEEEEDVEVFQLLLEEERKVLIEQEELLVLQKDLKEKVEDEEIELKRLEKVLESLESNQIKLNGDVNIEEKNSGNFHLFDFKTKKSLKENSSSNFALHAGDNNFVVDDELENLLRIRDELFQINRDIERKNNALNLSIHDEREAVVEARTRLRSLYYRHHIDVNHSIL